MLFISHLPVISSFQRIRVEPGEIQYTNPRLLWTPHPFYNIYNNDIYMSDFLRFYKDKFVENLLVLVTEFWIETYAKLGILTFNTIVNMLQLIVNSYTRRFAFALSFMCKADRNKIVTNLKKMIWRIDKPHLCLLPMVWRKKFVILLRIQIIYSHLQYNKDAWSSLLSFVFPSHMQAMDRMTKIIPRTGRNLGGHAVSDVFTRAKLQSRKSVLKLILRNNFLKINFKQLILRNLKN